MWRRISALGERAAHLRHVQRQQLQRDELRRERLGRGDADLRAGVRVDGAVGLARRHAADHVADGDAARALPARLAQRRQRVGGLAGLRDDDGELVLRDDRVAVAVLGAVVDFDRHLRQRFDQVLADQAGVPRRAAGDDRDLLAASRNVSSAMFRSSRKMRPRSSETRPRIVSRAADGCS